jgi:hypothetical protein
LGQPLAQHLGKAAFVGVERCGKPTPRPHHVADELGPLRPDRAEPDRARIAVEHRADVDEIDRLLMHDAFALLHQLLDETAQAELLGVGLDHGQGCP